MALINCPECKTEISDTALKCPNCAVQLRKATRSGFAKLVKWAYLGFNVIMPIWLISAMSAATEGVELMSEAEQAGAAIGTGIGAMIIFVIWGAGAVVGGVVMLVTRPTT